MEPKNKKEYGTPEIIFETELETKAGSPLGDPRMDNPTPPIPKEP